MADFRFNSADNCDDQLPNLVKVGVGPEGRGVYLELEDNKQDETYITCYTVDPKDGSREELWKTGNINGGSISVNDKFTYGVDHDYMQLIFTRRRPNTEDNWQYSTPQIPIDKSSKSDWEFFLKGQFNIEHTVEGHNTCEIEAALNPGSETPPSFEWNVESGDGIELSDGQGTSKATFKAKSTGMHTINTISCVAAEGEHHRRTAKYGVVTVGNGCQAIYYNESEFSKVEYEDVSGWKELYSGAEVPELTHLRFTPKSGLTHNNNYKVDCNSSSQKYIQDIDNPVMEWYMPGENAYFSLITEPKPIRTITFYIKDTSSTEWTQSELKLTQGAVKDIKGVCSDTGTTSGTWSSSKTTIATVDSTTTLQNKVTAKTTDGSCEIKLSLPYVDATFDADGNIITKGFQASTHIKKCEVGIKKAKAVYKSSNNTLTFYYDVDTHTEGTQYLLPTTATSGNAPWNSVASKIKSVIFDSSFKDYQPVSMSHWFNGLIQLKSIDFTNVDTTNVSLMDYLFNKCSALTSITWGEKFYTGNVTNMKYMFCNCSSLTTLHLPSLFYVFNVTTMECMFMNTIKLTDLIFPEIENYISFNTMNLTDIDHMFDGNGMEILRMPDDFDTRKVNLPGGFVHTFANCKNLRIIYMPENMVMSSSFGGSYYGFAAHCPKLETIWIYGDSSTSYVKAIDTGKDTCPFSDDVKLGAYRDNGGFSLLDSQVGYTVSNNRECMRSYNDNQYGALTPYSRNTTYINDFAKKNQSPKIQVGKNYFIVSKTSGKPLAAWYLDGRPLYEWRHPAIGSFDSNAYVYIKQATNSNFKIIQFPGNPDQPGHLEVPNALNLPGQWMRTHHIWTDHREQWWIFMEDTNNPGYFWIIPYGDPDLCLAPDQNPAHDGTWVRLYYRTIGDPNKLWKFQAR